MTFNAWFCVLLFAAMVMPAPDAAAMGRKPDRQTLPPTPVAEQSAATAPAGSTGAAELIPPPAPNHRKALVMGRGDPYREPGNIPTHPQMAKTTFLALVDNRGNDPAKGWTADLAWDVMTRLGMDPSSTPPEVLFEHIGRHNLGYRIVIQNGPYGQTLSFWAAAAANGMMPFAPHGDNTPGKPFNDPYGIRVAVSVGGGIRHNLYTYGTSLEFFDALPFGLWNNYEDAAQSWANQVVAAKFASILDRHPHYNIWDARQHMRQAASHWQSGWTEKNGFGRVNPNARVGPLQPAAPLAFHAALSRDRRTVEFSWHNFLTSDFAATVIARANGSVIYRGAGTHFTWMSDHDGAETFTFWTENTNGARSRLEANHTRTVEGLSLTRNQTCLVLGAPAEHDQVNTEIAERFRQTAPDWVCDVVVRPGNPMFDGLVSLPQGQVVAIRAGFADMVDYAIAKRYRIVVAPATPGAEEDLHRFKDVWDRATDHGILVVLAHAPPLAPRTPAEARRDSPPRLFSAVTVGVTIQGHLRSFGPGLEFVDAPPPHGGTPAGVTQNAAAGLIAAKLARILDAHPDYTLWDARQHLRQSASHYTAGWREKGGYGQPPAEPARIEHLDIAPPVDIQAVRSTDGKTVAFTWRNFRQTRFSATVIRNSDGTTIHEGAGNQFDWQSDVEGDKTFQFFSKDKSGRLSRAEPHTTLRVTGLSRN